MDRQLPGYPLFESHYKRIDVGPDQASTLAGLKRNVRNACAVRLSFAFNSIAGHRIPDKPAGVAGHVWDGVNGKYILGSRGFANFLAKTYAKPVINRSSAHRKEFAGRPGILYYEVLNWSDATGHIALWNGESGFRGAYFKEARRVWFWEMANGPGAQIAALL